MYFALGLLTAGLVVLVLMPAIWRRAVRLTRARVEASLPMTLAEIEADKDQLRANFAVANRKLELEAETLRGKLTEDTVARGRTRDEISALSRAKAALNETVATLEERVAELSGALSTSENKLATATTEIAVRDRAMADLDNRIADLRAEIAAAQQLTEEQRVEMVARNTEVANMSDRMAAAAAAEAAAKAERDKHATDLSLERDRLFAEQKRADGLAAGLAALEAERISRLAELERHATDRQMLEGNLSTERQRALALARELEATRAGSGGTSSTPSGEADALRKALTAAESEKNDLAARLAALESERVTLLAEARRAAGSARDGERAENRLLRDRLGEIAASVVRISEAMDDKPALPANAPPPLQNAPATAPSADEAPLAEFPLAERATGTRH
jgi:chromosome segregation ATPase